MPTAVWELIDERILLRTETGAALTPTARQIFQAQFTTDRQVDGFVVTRPSEQLPDLAFSRFPAEPTILITELGAVLRATVGALANERFVACAAITDQLISDGRWYPVHEELLAAARDWLRTIGAEPDGTVSVGALIAMRTRGDVPVRVLDEVRATSQRLGEVCRGSTAPIPGLEATLYPYQAVGIGYLALIADQGMGCILGDEMGLGKTLQVIGLLQSEKNSGRAPSLVVSPATLLENWRRELRQFAPSLKTQVHAGRERAGIAEHFSDFDVVVTSYETAVRDEPLLAAIPWNVIVLDEAQNIKNPKSIRTEAVKRLPRRVSIAVTGTPLENQIDDLWSVTDFVLPSLLGSLDDFRCEFDGSLEDANRIGTLIAPVLLRRRVADVARDLPEKLQIEQPLIMTDAMSEAYEDIRKQVLDEYGPQGGFVALMKLRVYCAGASEDAMTPNSSSVTENPKLMRLYEILDEVFLAREKALVFTSFKTSADRLMSMLSTRFHTGFFRTIDGRLALNERQRLVDDFFEFPGYGALILNPRAAGTGLNITAANHVIHYNPEWNPALMDQANARAFRRKQLRPVTVHYLYFADTVEEVMIQRAQTKRRLAEEAVTGHEGDSNALDIARALSVSPLRPGRTRRS
jgi:SNF2 family DNA or RNA helicase